MEWSDSCMLPRLLEINDWIARRKEARLNGREESKCLQLDEGFQVQELIHCNPKITT